MRAAAIAWRPRLERTRGVAQRLLALNPAYPLAALVVVYGAALAAFALTVRHNRWLYYMGGDELWHYTGAWLLVHGQLPPTYVGYGWSTLLAPIVAAAGANLASALPAIVFRPLRHAERTTSTIPVRSQSSA